MLEFDKVYPYLRVYFNHRSAAPKVWSIDDGGQANELNVAEVITEGIGLFKYNGQARNDQSPVAWLEFPQAKCWRVENILVISNESS